MSTAQSTFAIPQLARPSPAACRTFTPPTRSPASSFSKAPRPTGFSVQPNRLSLSSHYSHSSAGSIPPPPYHYPDVDQESGIPGYGEEQEVQTMARSLFYFGFLFPPFWVLGSLILVTPLTPDPSWHDTKPEEHIQATLAIMRAVERRWAWRCFIAFTCLLLIVLLVVGSVLLAHHFGRL